MNKAEKFDNQIAEVQRRMDSLKNQQQRLVKLYRYGEIDDEYMEREAREVKAQMERCQGDLDRLNEAGLQAADMRRMADAFEDFRQGWMQAVSDDEWTTPLKRRLMEIMETKVYVYPNGEVKFEAWVAASVLAGSSSPRPPIKYTLPVAGVLRSA